MTTEKNRDTVLVTGASSGIGEAICHALVARGHRVAAAARNRENLDKLADELGETLQPMVLDITDPDAVANLVNALPAGYENIDILINNAGHDVGGRRLFHEGSAEQWNNIIETNVQGTIRVTRVLIDGMLERGHGHIINLGSIAGLKPFATMTAYVASKFAVHGFSDNLRLDYAGKGIRVTEIMPGLVRTGFAEQRLGNADAARDFYDSFEVCLRAEDVAETVCFAIAQPRHVEIAQLVVLPVS